MRWPCGSANSESIRRWLAPVAIGALIGLVAFLLVLLIRTPRDTVVLEISRQPDPSEISVWVGGEVAQPGLYRLQRGSRVSDAIDAAGGLGAGANSEPLSMAAILEDADEIVVPGHAATRVEPTASTPDVNATSPPAAEPSTALININTADASSLEALPGIGPAIAGRVIAYRQENGRFASVDELEAVSGISARMVDEFRPYITVGQ